MKTGGIGASLSAVIHESLFNDLDHEVGGQWVGGQWVRSLWRTVCGWADQQASQPGGRLQRCQLAAQHRGRGAAGRRSQQ